MLIRLDGEVAVITGAANGIGRGVALGMADAGARVALLDRSESGLGAVRELIEPTGAGVSTYCVDVRDATAVAQAVNHVSDTLGDPTVLVTAAAVDGSASVIDLSVDDWKKMLDINLNGTFYSLKAVLPAMRRQGRGRVIFFGSNIGLKGGSEIAHYGASKAAVHGLTRCAAIDLAPFNITVNAVAPGPVDTDMLQSLPAAWLEAKHQEMLTGRFGTVADIVPTVILLASDSGAFYTGATLNLSGGDVLQ